MPPVLRHTLDHLLKNWRIGLPVILVIAFAFLLLNLLLFTNQVGGSFLSRMRASLSFTVYVEEDIDPFSLRKLIEDVERLDSVSPPAVYTSPEEVRQKFSVALGAKIPGTLVITPKNLDDREAIETYLKQSPYAPFLTFSGSSGETAETKTYERVKSQIERLQNLIRGVIFGLLIFSFLTIVVVIFTSLKLESLSRKRELTIMKIVGASPMFLEFPYLLEAMAYSVLGLILATIIFLGIPSLGFFPSDAFIESEWKTFPLGNIFLFELFVALLLGFIAGAISIQKIIRLPSFRHAN